MRLYVDIPFTIAVASTGVGFEAHLAGYNFALVADEDRELIAWHWHPVSRSDVTRPHVHLAGQIAPLPLGRGLEPLPLADLHIPSGMLQVGDIVWFLIHEVGIEPRRSDWERILERQA